MRVKGLAEVHGDVLRKAYQLLYDGALVGPAADQLFARLTGSHDSARSGFYEAFDQIQRLAAEAEGGPPRVGEPYVPGPPRGGLRASGDVRSGSPDLLNLLAIELGRAGRSWGHAGDDLTRVLAGLGLGTGPARAIARAGSGVAAHQGEVRRRRDELLKADQQAAIQAALNAVRGTAQAIGSADNERPGLLKTAWNAGWDMYVKRYLGGVWDGTKEIGLTALASNAATSPFYNMIDHEGWVQHGPVGMTTGLWNGVQHPVEFGKAIVNWDQWKKDPIRAYGEMVPGAILAVTTGGAGTAGSAGSKLGTVAGKFGKVERIPPRGRTEGIEKPGPGKLPDEPKARPGTVPGDGSSPPQQPRSPEGGSSAGGSPGDVRVGGRPAPGRSTAPKPEAPKFVNPQYSAERLEALTKAAGGLRGVYEKHGASLAGTVIGHEAKGLGSGQKAHIVRRVEELGLSQAESADAAMAAAQRAWGQAGQMKLPNGDTAVVPGHPQVPDTFVVGKDGKISVRKSRRWFDREDNEFKIEFLD
ncbi:hypothetical protein [Spirillospora sp. NPDC047279]|uniref:hypothetical protein n=1 Tax=Spirillospora sp. NPDC047279 TaxID=3155478 RepID=UPI0033D2D288